MTQNYVVIMAGGIGSRFWPYSRANKPKQFLDVLGTGRSLIQMTYDRFLNICPSSNIYVITNKSYYDLVKEQLPELSDDQILLEPIGRNTAAAVAYPAFKIKQRDPEGVMIVAPSDHVVFKDNIFEQNLTTAIDAAKGSQKLITLGIVPSRPETGYGYIQYHSSPQEKVKKVKTFTEKPELELAQKFIESGDFVWNAGIFIWSIDTITKAFHRYLKDVAVIFEEGNDKYYTSDEQSFIDEAYAQCKSISIDYGLMEKAEDVYMVKGEFDWSDLGSWDSLHETKDKDKNNNVVDATALLYDSKNCYVKGPKETLIVAQDLDGYLITQSDNVILICKKDAEKKFREFLSDAKEKGAQFG
ncbi:MULTISPECIES: mannose-1-phosphate guanylyltransferase [Roseivirga]|uniref:mannose-1-phosphate guanylyltransferase n=1 Tax=Roseivirga spongicola TaxID=333140 RepID=A0A150XI02_9BACT|nr:MULTISPECIES: mannose-1-phosphate guanylyltransferase [Roseivirga]KYG78358.1 mannose-1-phosphate guanylyltransferase [Roseivirga spongicola]MBO6496713.1 mannose-1-phosphate guanylyltransferase [Roseivirga sp.]MBO6660815.1 mannose-1-phosphate guanylyltransferase [Roseivirga sp.]MBO6759974.1 mannose-1-phosphate guanylyltransferase [Roseivirga sp.]MBO6909201.1 mannose-1-phosphate guanylyltransferase [Roseivirga sp.]